MAEAFTCPNCSAPLELSSASGDPPVITCRYCVSQVLVLEMQLKAPLAADVHPPSALDEIRPPKPPLPAPGAALEQVARLARLGESQAAVRLYREREDSSRQEAQQVVEMLRLDPQAQPDWVVERVRRQLKFTQSPEVKKPPPNRGNWVVYSMAILLALALLIPFLVFLLNR